MSPSLFFQGSLSVLQPFFFFFWSIPAFCRTGNVGRERQRISLFVFFPNSLLKRHFFGQPLQWATTSLSKSPSSPAHAMISTPCLKGGCCCRARWPGDTAGSPLAGSQVTGLLLSPPTDALGWQRCPPAPFQLTPAGTGGRQLTGKAANDCHPKEGL